MMIVMKIESDTPLCSVSCMQASVYEYVYSSIQCHAAVYGHMREAMAV
jgi:hypothetical protein